MISTRVKQTWRYLKNNWGFLAICIGGGLFLGLGIHLLADAWTFSRLETLRVYGGLIGSVISVLGAVSVSMLVVRNDNKRHEDLLQEPYVEALFLLDLDLREILLNLPFEGATPEDALNNWLKNSNLEDVKSEFIRIAKQSADTAITRTALARVSARDPHFLPRDIEVREKQANMRRWETRLGDYGPYLTAEIIHDFVTDVMEFRSLIKEYRVDLLGKTNRP